MTWKRRLRQALVLGAALAFVGAVTGLVLGEQGSVVAIMAASTALGGAVVGLLVRIGK